MDSDDVTPPAAPAGHTPNGGVLVGSPQARRRLVDFEDLQCPFCRRFEQECGDVLRREVASGSVAVEYRIRCFLGPESVRAANALALAAEAGAFDPLRTALFDAQPAEGSGGFTAGDLVAAGAAAGLRTPGFVEGVRTGRYEAWCREADGRFQELDPDGTPAALLDGEPVDPAVLYDAAALGALVRG